jgi:hypothetical protein
MKALLTRTKTILGFIINEGRDLILPEHDLGGWITRVQVRK